MGLVWMDMAKKKLNRDERRARQSGSLAQFVRQYGRKSQRGIEPNDRHYSDETQKKVRRMKPELLDALLREDEE